MEGTMRTRFEQKLFTAANVIGRIKRAIRYRRTVELRRQVPIYADVLVELCETLTLAPPVWAFITF